MGRAARDQHGGIHVRRTAFAAHEIGAAHSGSADATGRFAIDEFTTFAFGNTHWLCTHLLPPICGLISGRGDSVTTSEQIPRGGFNGGTDHVCGYTGIAGRCAGA
jgi:hypothetical protein